MRTPHRPLRPQIIAATTSLAKSYAEELIEAVENFQKDLERSHRLKEAVECKTCYYLRRTRGGGAAITCWNCGVCGTEHVWGSTATPRVCKPCAREHDLCHNCGGDLHMRERRRKFPTPVLEPVATSV